MMSRARSAAAIFGVWALALSQPLVDVLRRAPEFFVAHRADALDAAVLVAALGLIGPVLILLGLAAVATIHRPAAEVGTAAAIGLLGSLVPLQLAYRAGAEHWPAAVLVLVIGTIGIAAAWRLAPPFRAFLVVLSPAALVVPAVFLLAGPFRDTTEATEAAGPAPRETPVVLVVFDELSLVSLMDATGSINRARYPNLAALASDGIWFRNATAVSDYTRWALPAILTGRYPIAATTPTPADHPDTLFSLLGRTHAVEAFEAVTALCPRTLCDRPETRRRDRWRAMLADLEIVAAHVWLPPAARAGLPDLTATWANFADDAGSDEADVGDDPGDADGPRVIRARPSWRRVWRGEAGTDHLAATAAFLDGISPEDRQPGFYFTHSLASHHPARWLPSGQRIANRRAMPGLRDGVWTEVEWQVVQHQHAHLMQTGLADTLVGRLRDRLLAANLYDRALVIVTADHGVSFRPGDRMRAFSGGNVAELAAVPLIVKLPASMPRPATGAIDDRNAETIDILPTVADVLDADVAWPTDGSSLVAEDARRPEKRFFFNVATMEERVRPEELASRRDAAVRRQSAIFGDGPWPAFTVPALASLIGRDVASFGEIAVQENVRVAVDDRRALDSVDLDAPEVPAQVSGRIRLSGGLAFDRSPLAIALNGRLVATTQGAPPGGRFTAMLPPSALRNGSNEMEIFVVDPARPDRLRRPR
jgi:arylsulfatase A-like enzyme